MGAIYDGEHAVIFGPTDGSAGVNTWTDWFLIPTSRPTMSMPAAQSKFVDIPGMNGSYDISGYLTSDTTYQDRSGSFEFVLDIDQGNWLDICRKIIVYLHGQRLRMTLTDDPTWYYEGRFSLNEWKSDEKYSRVTIDYRVSPFKYSIYGTYVQNIYWDSFCFETDTDWSILWQIPLSRETKKFALEANGIRFTPTIRLPSGKFKTGDSVTATFGGVTKTVSTSGGSATLGKSSRNGKTTLTLTGTGTVDVGWVKTSL